VAPVFTAVAAKPLSALIHQPMFSTWKIIAPSDALGLVVVLPVILFCLSGEYRSFRKLRPHLLAAISSLAVSSPQRLRCSPESRVPILF
jgi:integral membrane sensor domain MASE1